MHAEIIKRLEEEFGLKFKLMPGSKKYRAYFEDGSFIEVHAAFKKEGRYSIYYQKPDGRYLLLAVVLPPPPDAPQKSELPLGIYSFISDDGLTFSNQQVVLQELFEQANFSFYKVLREKQLPLMR